MARKLLFRDISAENLKDENYVKEAELNIKKYKVPRSYYASHDILVTPNGLDRVSSKDWQDDGVTVTAKNEAKS